MHLSPGQRPIAERVAYELSYIRNFNDKQAICDRLCKKLTRGYNLRGMSKDQMLRQKKEIISEIDKQINFYIDN